MPQSIDHDHDGVAAGARRPRHLCGTAHDFAAQVIYDGRFLGSFTVEPERVAEQLGVGVTPELAMELRRSDRRHLLGETTRHLTRKYGQEHEPKEISAKHVPAIVIGFGVAIVCLVLDNPDGPPVDDESEEADYKL